LVPLHLLYYGVNVLLLFLSRLAQLIEETSQKLNIPVFFVVVNFKLLKSEHSAKKSVWIDIYAEFVTVIYFMKEIIARH
jgi:hypothetical protein